MQPVGGNFGSCGQGLVSHGNLWQGPFGPRPGFRSLAWEAHSPGSGSRGLITFFSANSPADPALTLNWGGLGDAGWAKPEKFPPDAGGTPGCISDAGFCFLITNPRLFGEPWNWERPYEGADVGGGGGGKSL